LRQFGNEYSFQAPDERKRAFWQTTAPELNLTRLSREAGVHLLQRLGVKGSLIRNIPLASGGREPADPRPNARDVETGDDIRGLTPPARLVNEFEQRPDQANRATAGTSASSTDIVNRTGCQCD
jgi:hypothetical protein